MLKQHPELHQRISHAGLVVFTLIAMLSLCAELYAGSVWGVSSKSIGALVIIHLVTVGALGGWVFYNDRKGMDINLPLFLMVAVGGLSIFGAVICLVVAVLYAINEENTVPFMTWFSELFPEHYLDECEEVYERIIFGLDNVVAISTVEPFQDVFAYGTLQQKQTVLVKITRYFRPTLAPLLMRAVNDSDVAVRVQAATVVTKIERNFMEKTLLLERTLADDPNNIHKITSFAALCDEYAGSGILDTASEKKSRMKAIALYERCLKLKPMEDHLRIILGRLYFQMHEPEKAYNYFKHYIDQHGLTSFDLVLWYMETLMALGDYQKMRNLVNEFPLKFSQMDGEIDQSEVVALIQCWNKGIGGQRMCWETSAR